ncbi:hypothetical protein BDW22DRAFT_1347062 [Trametopsis cervina]|nr:hypothetical protein BDW22DRAFT_1347062 [Trametopsis cervina]
MRAVFASLCVLLLAFSTANALPAPRANKAQRNLILTLLSRVLAQTVPGYAWTPQFSTRRLSPHAKVRIRLGTHSLLPDSDPGIGSNGYGFGVIGRDRPRAI